MNKFFRFPLLALSLLSVSLSMVSCSKDEGGLVLVTPHDASPYMRNMHEGMALMESMQKTQDPDNDYASMMIVHHQIAIKNSQEELRSGKDSEMKAMAQMIIAKQEAEIAQFQAFLAGHPAHAPAVPAFNMLQMMNMTQMMQAVDLRPLTGNPDFDFAQLMVDHHQAAIENSDALLKYGRENATRALAEQIIADQKMEIKELQEWLLANKKY
ncbi:DUF305 domain-containing protein [Hymenobacter sp. HDW8]|uniref:DUF305 domain-containing protein n=1 Tax=Hymenobacter sp. HDW8 TaxID=2714932 RepID=UPI00140A2746|nr:DUF305 domain-containing protein [Hymenobacter sp. HDW8]QIL78211.1 DUF305 domain-containing protein [Hymenobacter sp. HDW8]